MCLCTGAHRSARVTLQGPAHIAVSTRESPGVNSIEKNRKIAQKASDEFSEFQIVSIFVRKYIWPVFARCPAGTKFPLFFMFFAFPCQLLENSCAIFDVHKALGEIFADFSFLKTA